MARAGSLVGAVRVPEALELLPTHWQVKPDPGVSARPLAGRAVSWLKGPGIPELVSDPWEGAFPDSWYGVRGVPKVLLTC